MAKKDEKTVYCAFCGTKNKVEDNSCKKCNKKLNPKNHLFKDYLKDHVKDDVKSNLEDNIVDIIIEWIKAHLFGLFGTALIGIIAVGVIINEVNINNTKKKIAIPKIVTKAPTMIEKCTDKDLTDKIKVCDAGYTLSGENCIKTTRVSASSKKVCNNGYTLNGNRCISNNTVAKSVKYTCDKSKATTYPRIALRSVTLNGNSCTARYCYPIAGTLAENVRSDADCSSFFNESYAADASYYCKNYTDGNGNCRNVATPTVKYYCNSGTLNGKECITISTKTPREECPENTTFNEKCGKCERS